MDGMVTSISGFLNVSFQNFGHSSAAVAASPPLVSDFSVEHIIKATFHLIKASIIKMYKKKTSATHC